MDKLEIPFEYLEHTADVGLAAYGRDLKEAFANAALGLMNLIADLDGVKERVSRQIKLASSDEEALLVDWLNELLYLLDAEQLLFSRFEIEKLSGHHLQATAYGEKADPSRHGLKTAVKAATYHMLSIERRGEMVRVQVLLDL